MRKVAIVGSCPSSRLLAPFEDPNWEIWGLSPDNVNILPRITVWFELHGDWGHAGIGKTPEDNYINWVNNLPCTVYAQRLDTFPRATLFPADELLKSFGRFSYYWMTSSVAWMLALAIYEKVDEIGIWGCDMAIRDEYSHQLPACHRWIELATERKIPVFVPPESDLLNPPPMYGYSIMSPMGRKIDVRGRELRQRINDLNAKIKEHERVRTHLLGALDDLDYINTRWINPHRME